MIEAPATGKYYEDYAVGDKWISNGRTISSGDIKLFTQWTRDENPLYVDEEFATQSVHGSIIAPETLVIMCTCFNYGRTGATNGTGYANLGFEYEILAPVKLFDTIQLILEIKGKRDSKSIPTVGLIERGVTVYNQHGELILRGVWNAMALRKTPLAANA